VNATGVVLHTGLGRAPLHPEAAEAVAAAARGYGVLELDRWSGERNRRDERASVLLARLTGCEAAVAVNNNAAAVLLVLNTFAHGRETLVSRGELVEIGGSFRMPDVMERAGTKLVEVGTTNRTRLSDYRAALSARTGLVLKVHRSNFRVEGFVEEVGAAELAGLAREHGVASAYDLGSGLLEAAGAPVPPGLADEPRVAEAVASGADVVTFSGDKLLGGPQAGLAVGRAAAVAALRANPLYRALRLDKLTLAGLERTLELYLAGRGGELPARALLALPEAELERRAETLRARLAGLGGLTVFVQRDASQAGSGSAPGVALPTHVVCVSHARLPAAALSDALRAADPPVFARIKDGRVVLDPRTLLAGEDELVARALAALG
jgi:L-seryl-tRNA(Ser) seleniumtransferase